MRIPSLEDIFVWPGAGKEPQFFLILALIRPQANISIDPQWHMRRGVTTSTLNTAQKYFLNSLYSFRWLTKRLVTWIPTHTHAQWTFPEHLVSIRDTRMALGKLDITASLWILLIIWKNCCLWVSFGEFLQNSKYLPLLYWSHSENLNPSDGK